MSSGRGGVLVAVCSASALLTVSWICAPAKRLVLNTTASAPMGFYWMSTGRAEVGDLALVRPPRPLARWLAARGYLPLNVPLIKHVAARGGQSVCVRRERVEIDGRLVGQVLKRDLVGRPLQGARLCRRLTADEIFLFNGEAPRSLDGRYFGPLPRACVAGRLRPLWTWER
ncbi:S26 family signal peptidase [Caulobacter endophyticus]|uniref:Peptidase n=1 Tax=Caulobacter endophyticus TaxID=2172652 RepID=A0A2T9JEG7_9CAUL|nr:S26 family signal peptidase [Caulobacter endophyticus]PVM82093.1 peptidase [Caulobacter endophyticus]